MVVILHIEHDLRLPLFQIKNVEQKLFMPNLNFPRNGLAQEILNYIKVNLKINLIYRKLTLFQNHVFQ